MRIPFCARQAFAALRKRTSEGMVAARDLPVHAGDGRGSGGTAVSTDAVDHAGEVGPWSYPRRTLSRPEKYERLAFTFCRMGTIGLIAWVLGPPLFVLIVAIAAVVLYARAITLGVGWTKCFLRRPTYIVGLLAARRDRGRVLAVRPRGPLAGRLTPDRPTPRGRTGSPVPRTVSMAADRSPSLRRSEPTCTSITLLPPA